MASAGTGGVGPGFTKLWDCLTITEFGITRLESAARLIGLITLKDEVNRVSVVREIRMLRLTRRGLETGSEYRASLRPYLRGLGASDGPRLPGI